MTISFSSVIISVAIVALVLTAILKIATKRVNNVVLSALQNFCGIFFVFSGLVKAVDPMGTAFKMEQYFVEFQATFQDTAFDFLAGLFPFFSEYSIGFSVTMIVLEIVVGIMLVIGAKRKLTSWIFLIIIGFFTILTGFTYLTGHVPTTSNFFSFGEWGPYVETNMRVTDCGCFGDFLKIEPKLSFMKDVFLMIPALIFVFKHSDMHQLFSKQVRNVLVGLSTIGMLWYCLSNFLWDLPDTDFRPFRENVNIRDQRQAEMDSEAAVQITHWKLKNRASAEVVELSTAVYFKEMASTYTKDKWEVIEQIKSEPAVKPTKLSEFVVTGKDGYDVADDLLNDPSYSFWIISYEVPYDVSYTTETNMDTLFVMDSLKVAGSSEIEIVKAIGGIEKKEVKKANYAFDPAYEKYFKEKVMSVVNETKIPAHAMLGGVDATTIDALRSSFGLNIDIHEADELLLKTMIRSNPGLILVKDGTILKKWHKDNLPSADEVKAMLTK